MEETFIAILDLSLTANILFVSDSITDILEYQPDQVRDKSCFDFFHPDEIPFARSIHNRGILLDKAAVLHYARIMSYDGRWVSCECCFTVVHDVLVASVSVYRRGEKSQRRAIEAPQIRRIFSCSPRDPRYHMLEHLSPKFRMPPTEREPRAALILNRFTRSLGIMFSTNAIADILGLEPEQIKYKSFYECIQENCLRDAVNCLESAKANDSIAYLRFWSRDPRRPEDFDNADYDGGQAQAAGTSQQVANSGADGTGRLYPGDDDRNAQQQSDSDSGGVRLDMAMDIDQERPASPRVKLEDQQEWQDGGYGDQGPGVSRSRTSSPSPFVSSSFSSAAQQSFNRDRNYQPQYPLPSVELEAVVSCTSDGLVVVLRRARPPVPSAHPRPNSIPKSGIFAAPWGHFASQSRNAPVVSSTPSFQSSTWSQPLSPNQTVASSASVQSEEHLMKSIRDVAIFAWALVGINGSLAEHSRGIPSGEAQPVDGLPIWDPHAGPIDYGGPENQAMKRNGWSQYANGSLGGRFDGIQD